MTNRNATSRPAADRIMTQTTAAEYVAQTQTPAERIAQATRIARELRSWADAWRAAWQRNPTSAAAEAMDRADECATRAEETRDALLAE